MAIFSKILSICNSILLVSVRIACAAGLCATGLELKATATSLLRNNSCHFQLWLLTAVMLTRYGFIYLCTTASAYFVPVLMTGPIGPSASLVVKTMGSYAMLGTLYGFSILIYIPHAAAQCFDHGWKGHPLMYMATVYVVIDLIAFVLVCSLCISRRIIPLSIFAFCTCICISVTWIICA